MLMIIRSMRELNFHWLMDVYRESNMLNGMEFYPEKEPNEQLLLAEADFYQYLSDVFFRNPDSFYAVWKLDNGYSAPLRVEPFRDGMLINGLETAPELRQQGFAAKLVFSVVDYLSKQGNGVLYSHVSKTNIPSLSLHKKCGFKINSNCAVYLDGSVLNNSYTLSITR